MSVRPDYLLAGPNVNSGRCAQTTPGGGWEGDYLPRSGESATTAFRDPVRPRHLRARLGPQTPSTLRKPGPDWLLGMDRLPSRPDLVLLKGTEQGPGGKIHGIDKDARLHLVEVTFTTDFGGQGSFSTA